MSMKAGVPQFAPLPATRSFVRGANCDPNGGGAFLVHQL